VRGARGGTSSTVDLVEQTRRSSILGDRSGTRALAEADAASITEIIEQLLEVTATLSAASIKASYFDDRVGSGNKVEQARWKNGRESSLQRSKPPHESPLWSGQPIVIFAEARIGIALSLGGEPLKLRHHEVVIEDDQAFVLPELEEIVEHAKEVARARLRGLPYQAKRGLREGDDPAFPVGKSDRRII
jgi:hypothetical protein